MYLKCVYFAFASPSRVFAANMRRIGSNIIITLGHLKADRQRQTAANLRLCADSNRIITLGHSSFKLFHLPPRKKKKSFFFEPKKCPKSQKMKLQKHYLEVSSSSRNEARAFFRFIAERKNCEFFQMSQKKRLEILRCVGVLKGFFYKKTQLLGSKKLGHFTAGNHFEFKSARYALPCRDAVVMIVPPMPVCRL
jgi:hypothetical protein